LWYVYIKNYTGLKLKSSASIHLKLVEVSSNLLRVNSETSNIQANQY